MTSLYEVLKAQKMGAAIAPDYFTALWAGATGGGGSWETIEDTGAVPVEILAAGEPLIDCLISGNMNQTGTPSPQSIIMPQECGERTENIVAAETNNTNPIAGLSAVWEKDSSYMVINGKATGGGSYRFATIELDAGTYTLSITGLDETGWDKTGFYLAGVDTVRVQGVRTYTITEPVSARLQFVVQPSEISYENRKVTIMFTKTSTPLPYSPYGYKLDISSGNTTTPIYLGEVETERRIGKLVLDGTEVGWNTSTQSGTGKRRIFLGNAVTAGDGARYICTHYQSTAYNTAYPGVGYISINSAGTLLIGTETNDIEAFKTWLSTQYANGTPVTIWYVLANPTTAVINEPLRKIGDYADTISAEQAGVSIPTVEGSNVVDVLTTLKPSEIYLKYKGRESE